MKTLTNLNFRNTSAFTFIQEDKERPGILITFLSHAIVEIDVTDPQNLQLLAGRHDRAGYRDGSGTNIRFSSPSDMVQLNRNSWIIADVGNNCLRDFNYEENSQGTGDAINTWSFICNPNINSSSIGNTVSESTFYRPRGLAYVQKENKIYITYEEPYSLAEIYLSSKRVIILRQSNSWMFRRIIPFPSELIISTEPGYFILSYRDSKLGKIVGDEWQSNISPVGDRSQPYASGIEVLPGRKLFLETMTNENVLALIDQESETITKVCTGVQGHIDSQLTECQLDRPMYVVNINNTIYIGEHGQFAGGIRTVELTNESKNLLQIC